MCLAVPARIVEQQDDETATADLHGNRVRVSTMLVPEAGVGSWVLVHAGFAIETLDEDEAQATFAVLRDLGIDPTGAQDVPGPPVPTDAPAATTRPDTTPSQEAPR
jgi:hydrogenase expression/formation protein HypC